MSEKFICLNCEENKRNFIVSLDLHQKCDVCGSDKVITATAFLAAADRQKAIDKISEARKATTPPIAPPRVDKQKEKRTAKARAFLLRNKFIDLNAWWDGDEFLVTTSVAPFFDEDVVPTGSLEWLRVIFENKSGARRVALFYFDPEDFQMRSVDGEVL